jgi:hypothetical protein
LEKITFVNNFPIFFNRDPLLGAAAKLPSEEHFGKQK